MADSLPDIYPNQIGDAAYQDFGPMIEIYGDPAGALLVYLAGIARMFKEVDDIASDGPNDEPGWSQIFDLTRAKTEWLPWMGQMVGYPVPDKPTDQTLEEYDANQRVRIITRSAYRRGTSRSAGAAATRHHPRTVFRPAILDQGLGVLGRHPHERG
jgi:hypothetical protein